MQTKQKESKSVPSKVTSEAIKDNLAIVNNELESVVKAPFNSSTSKQLETKTSLSNNEAENKTEASDDKRILPSNLLESILNDRSNVIEGSSRSATARELNSKLSVVNHVNSHRCKIHSSLQKKLQLEVGDVVQVIVKDQMVLLLKSTNDKGIIMKPGGNLYCKELVERVTNMFQFDFTQQSTHHLTEVTFQNWNDQLVAILTP